jgi:general secretion pathway protein G
MTFFLRAPHARSTIKGFTLIELLVVITIIALLGALIVPNLFSSVDDARRTAARTDVNTIMQSLQRYKLDNQRFPNADQGLAALITKPTVNPIPPNWRPYMPKLPNDPWGAPYQYANPGVKGEVDVFSFGADGKAGGEGNDADIGSWQ